MIVIWLFLHLSLCDILFLSPLKTLLINTCALYLNGYETTRQTCMVLVYIFLPIQSLLFYPLYQGWLSFSGAKQNISTWISRRYSKSLLINKVQHVKNNTIRSIRVIFKSSQIWCKFWDSYPFLCFFCFYCHFMWPLSREPTIFFPISYYLIECSVL